MSGKHYEEKLLQSIQQANALTLFKMAFFRVVHGWGGGKKRPPPLQIYYTYPTMMKLGTAIPYLKKIRVTHPLSSAKTSNFSPEISKFYYIKKYMYRLHFDIKLLILLTFLESIKIVLIKKVAILVMPAKTANPGLLKIKIV